jgi:hypothetical protein
MYIAQPFCDSYSIKDQIYVPSGSRLEESAWVQKGQMQGILRTIKRGLPIFSIRAFTGINMYVHTVLYMHAFTS